MSKETRDKHVIGLIESGPLSALTETELALISEHTADCSSCRTVYASAQVCSLLLQERATSTVDPPPFFHTRVMASLRERQSANDVWSLSRLWRTAGALASSMVAAVVLLGVLTFVLPNNQNSTQAVSRSANIYSAEEVILNQNNATADPASDGQILTTLYGDEEASQ